MRKLIAAIAILTVMGTIQNAHAEFSQDCLIDNGHENTEGNPKYFKWVMLSTNQNIWQGLDPRNIAGNHGPFFSLLLERNSRLDPEQNRPQIKLESAAKQKDGNNNYLVCTYSVGENVLLQGNTSKLKIPSPYTYNDCNIKENPWGITCR